MHLGTYRYIATSELRDEELGVDKRETNVGEIVILGGVRGIHHEAGTRAY